MEINNQVFTQSFLDDFPFGTSENNCRPFLEKELGVNGFGRIILFKLSQMVRETKSVRDLCIEEQESSLGQEATFTWLGQKKASITPGDIDPNQFVVIGCFDYDCPIALDYRPTTIYPTVVYNGGKGWEYIGLVDDFIQKIKKYISSKPPAG